MKNITLIGLSGSGKSTLSRYLADELGMTAVDLDQVIEEEAGMPIKEIFRLHGEEHFRDLESDAVKRLAGRENLILAPGGGAVLRQVNRQALRENSLVIFLDRPVEQILGDLETDGRPLLQQGAEQLHAMAAQRRPHYEAACHVTFPNTYTLEEAVPALLALIRGELLGESDSGYAVIGDPIGHSLSPPIHRAVFEHLGTPDPYHAILVRKGELAAFMERATRSRLKGFNITAPHKKEIIPLLDWVDEGAKRCEAVNTVVRREGGWHGYNTDRVGLLRAVQDLGHGYKNRRILILGTGGAAAGVALEAAEQGAKAVAVHGRRPEAVEAIREMIGGTIPVTTGGLMEETLRAACREADLLINCIPLGMTGTEEDGRSFGFLTALPPGSLVVDLIYSPPRTPILQAAEALGYPVLNGLPMLIHQAILADELYLGRPLDHKPLYQRVRHALNQNNEE